MAHVHNFKDVRQGELQINCVILCNISGRPAPLCYKDAGYACNHIINYVQKIIDS